MNPLKFRTSLREIHLVRILVKVTLKEKISLNSSIYFVLQKCAFYYLNDLQTQRNAANLFAFFNEISFAIPQFNRDFQLKFPTENRSFSWLRNDNIPFRIRPLPSQKQNWKILISSVVNFFVFSQTISVPLIFWLVEKVNTKWFTISIINEKRV